MKYILFTWLCMITFSILSTDVSAQKIAWPLKVSANQKYLEDQRGRPFYIITESAWKAYTISQEDQDVYLDNLKDNGFNSFQLWGPKSSNGNDQWYSRAENLISKARERDILVFVCMTLGKKPMQNYNDSTAFAHGLMMAKRFSSAKCMDNIIFISGFDTKSIDSRWEMMALGAKYANPEVLVTFHSSRGNSSVENWDSCKAWIDINGIYTHHPPWWRSGNDYPYTETWTNWKRYGHCMPMFEIEAVYEDEHDLAGKEKNMRKQHWWISTSGNVAGQAYGHRLIWSMREGWQSVGLKDTFRLQIIHIRNFMEPLEWWKLIPDTDNNLILTGNKGADDTRVTASLSEDGSFAICYTPEGLDPVLDMSKFMGPVNARWYDTSTGEYLPPEGPFPNTGKKTFFTPDDADDWALLLFSDR